MRTFDEYQSRALRFRPPTEDPRMNLAIFGLGLAGEAGEVVELLKKHLGHGKEMDVAAFERELGDVMWYLTALAAHFGLRLEYVAETNIEKLERRYPNGFVEGGGVR